MEKSGPLARPINSERLRDQFMFGFVMAECECCKCGNWWSRPQVSALTKHLTAITVRRTQVAVLIFSQLRVGPGRIQRDYCAFDSAVE